ncbi:ORF1A [Veiled chameleon serpentovirus B]|nr:ORF1A [Veiled chameleon serpentovirus B]QRC47040.1 ORF1A [Veiled chameleon serpentovirus B]
MVVLQVVAQNATKSGETPGWRLPLKSLEKGKAIARKSMGSSLTLTQTTLKSAQKCGPNLSPRAASVEVENKNSSPSFSQALNGCDLRQNPEASISEKSVFPVDSPNSNQSCGVTVTNIYNNQSLTLKVRPQIWYPSLENDTKIPLTHNISYVIPPKFKNQKFDEKSSSHYVGRHSELYSHFHSDAKAIDVGSDGRYPGVGVTGGPADCGFELKEVRKAKLNLLNQEVDVMSNQNAPIAQDLSSTAPEIENIVLVSKDNASPQQTPVKLLKLINEGGVPSQQEGENKLNLKPTYTFAQKAQVVVQDSTHTSSQEAQVIDYSSTHTVAPARVVDMHSIFYDTLQRDSSTHTSAQNAQVVKHNSTHTFAQKAQVVDVHILNNGTLQKDGSAHTFAQKAKVANILNISLKDTPQMEKSKIKLKRRVQRGSNSPQVTPVLIDCTPSEEINNNEKHPAIEALDSMIEDIFTQCDLSNPAQYEKFNNQVTALINECETVDLLGNLKLLADVSTKPELQNVQEPFALDLSLSANNKSTSSSAESVNSGIIVYGLDNTPLPQQDGVEPNSGNVSPSVESLLDDVSLNFLNDSHPLKVVETPPVPILTGEIKPFKLHNYNIIKMGGGSVVYVSKPTPSMHSCGSCRNCITQNGETCLMKVAPLEEQSPTISNVLTDWHAIKKFGKYDDDVEFDDFTGKDTFKVKSGVVPFRTFDHKYSVSYHQQKLSRRKAEAIEKLKTSKNFTAQKVYGAVQAHDISNNAVTVPVIISNEFLTYAAESLPQPEVEHQCLTTVAHLLAFALEAYGFDAKLILSSEICNLSALLALLPPVFTLVRTYEATSCTIAMYETTRKSSETHPRVKRDSGLPVTQRCYHAELINTDKNSTQVYSTPLNNGSEKFTLFAYFRLEMVIDNKTTTKLVHKENQSYASAIRTVQPMGTKPTNTSILSPKKPAPLRFISKLAKTNYITNNAEILMKLAVKQSTVYSRKYNDEKRYYTPWLTPVDTSTSKVFLDVVFPEGTKPPINAEEDLQACSFGVVHYSATCSPNCPSDKRKYKPLNRFTYQTKPVHELRPINSTASGYLTIKRQIHNKTCLFQLMSGFCEDCQNHIQDQLRWLENSWEDYLKTSDGEQLLRSVFYFTHFCVDCYAFIATTFCDCPHGVSKSMNINAQIFAYKKKYRKELRRVAHSVPHHYHVKFANTSRIVTQFVNTYCSKMQVCVLDGLCYGDPPMDDDSLSGRVRPIPAPRRFVSKLPTQEAQSIPKPAPRRRVSPPLKDVVIIDNTSTGSIGVTPFLKSAAFSGKVSPVSAPNVTVQANMSAPSAVSTKPAFGLSSTQFTQVSSFQINQQESQTSFGKSSPVSASNIGAPSGVLDFSSTQFTQASLSSQPNQPKRLFSSVCKGENVEQSALASKFTTSKFGGFDQTVPHNVEQFLSSAPSVNQASSLQFEFINANNVNKPVKPITDKASRVRFSPETVDNEGKTHRKTRVTQPKSHDAYKVKSVIGSVATDFALERVTGLSPEPLVRGGVEFKFIGDFHGQPKARNFLLQAFEKQLKFYNRHVILDKVDIGNCNPIILVQTCEYMNRKIGVAPKMDDIPQWKPVYFIKFLPKVGLGLHEPKGIANIFGHSEISVSNFVCRSVDDIVPSLFKWAREVCVCVYNKLTEPLPSHEHMRRMVAEYNAQPKIREASLAAEQAWQSTQGNTFEYSDEDVNMPAPAFSASALMSEEVILQSKTPRKDLEQQISQDPPSKKLHGEVSSQPVLQLFKTNYPKPIGLPEFRRRPESHPAWFSFSKSDQHKLKSVWQARVNYLQSLSRDSYPPNYESFKLEECYAYDDGLWYNYSTAQQAKCETSQSGSPLASIQKRDVGRDGEDDKQTKPIEADGVINNSKASLQVSTTRSSFVARQAMARKARILDEDNSPKKYAQAVKSSLIESKIQTLVQPNAASQPSVAVLRTSPVTSKNENVKYIPGLPPMVDVSVKKSVSEESFTPPKSVFKASDYVVSLYDDIDKSNTAAIVLDPASRRKRVSQSYKKNVTITLNYVSKARKVKVRMSKATTGMILSKAAQILLTLPDTLVLNFKGAPLNMMSKCVDEGVGNNSEVYVVVPTDISEDMSSCSSDWERSIQKQECGDNQEERLEASASALSSDVVNPQSVERAEYSALSTATVEVEDEVEAVKASVPSSNFVLNDTQSPQNLSFEQKTQQVVTALFDQIKSDSSPYVQTQCVSVEESLPIVATIVDPQAPAVESCSEGAPLIAEDLASSVVELLVPAVESLPADSTLSKQQPSPPKPPRTSCRRNRSRSSTSSDGSTRSFGPLRISSGSSDDGSVNSLVYAESNEDLSSWQSVTSIPSVQFVKAEATVVPLMVAASCDVVQLESVSVISGVEPVVAAVSEAVVGHVNVSEPIKVESGIDISGPANVHVEPAAFNSEFVNVEGLVHSDPSSSSDFEFEDGPIIAVFGNSDECAELIKCLASHVSAIFANYGEASPFFDDDFDGSIVIYESVLHTTPALLDLHKTIEKAGFPVFPVFSRVMLKFNPHYFLNDDPMDMDEFIWEARECLKKETGCRNSFCVDVELEEKFDLHRLLNVLNTFVDGFDCVDVGDSYPSDAEMPNSDCDESVSSIDCSVDFSDFQCVNSNIPQLSSDVPQNMPAPSFHDVASTDLPTFSINLESLNIVAGNLPATVFKVGCGFNGGLNFSHVKNCQESISFLRSLPGYREVDCSIYVTTPSHFYAVVEKDGHFAVHSSGQRECHVNGEPVDEILVSSIKALFVPIVAVNTPSSCDQSPINQDSFKRIGEPPCDVAPDNFVDDVSFNCDAGEPSYDCAPNDYGDAPPKCVIKYKKDKFCADECKSKYICSLKKTSMYETDDYVRDERTGTGWIVDPGTVGKFDWTQLVKDINDSDYVQIPYVKNLMAPMNWITGNGVVNWAYTKQPPSTLPLPEKCGVIEDDIEFYFEDDLNKHLKIASMYMVGNVSYAEGLIFGTPVIVSQQLVRWSDLFLDIKNLRFTHTDDLLDAYVYPGYPELQYRQYARDSANNRLYRIGVRYRFVNPKIFDVLPTLVYAEKLHVLASVSRLLYNLTQHGVTVSSFDDFVYCRPYVSLSHNTKFVFLDEFETEFSNLSGRPCVSETSPSALHYGNNFDYLFDTFVANLHELDVEKFKGVYKQRLDGKVNLDLKLAIPYGYSKRLALKPKVTQDYTFVNKVSAMALAMNSLVEFSRYWTYRDSDLFVWSYSPIERAQLLYANIDSYLAKGSFGVVFSIKDDKESILKITIDIIANREVEALQMLNNCDFVPRLKSVDYVPYNYNAKNERTLTPVGNLCLMHMEKVDGSTICFFDDLDDDEKKTSFLVEFVNALYALDNLGICHNDLHSGNIMYTKDGHLKIIDLGMCRFVYKNELTKEHAVQIHSAYLWDAIFQMSYGFSTPCEINVESFYNQAFLDYQTVFQLPMFASKPFVVEASKRLAHSSPGACTQISEVPILAVNDTLKNTFEAIVKIKDIPLKESSKKKIDEVLRTLVNCPQNENKILAYTIYKTACQNKTKTTLFTQGGIFSLVCDYYQLQEALLPNLVEMMSNEKFVTKSAKQYYSKFKKFVEKNYNFDTDSKSISSVEVSKVEKTSSIVQPPLKPASPVGEAATPVCWDSSQESIFVLKPPVSGPDIGSKPVISVDFPKNQTELVFDARTAGQGQKVSSVEVIKPAGPLPSVPLLAPNDDTTLTSTKDTVASNFASCVSLVDCSLFLKLKFQTRPRDVANHNNFCFVNTCIPVWKSLGKYLTEESEKALADAVLNTQGDAAELLNCTGIAHVKFDCPVHGTSYCNDGAIYDACCVQVRCASASLCLVRDRIVAPVTVYQIKFFPKFWIHYTGDGVNGHWVCYECDANGVYWRWDFQRRMQVPEIPPISAGRIFTVCSHDVSDSQVTCGPLSGLVGRVVVLTNNIEKWVDDFRGYLSSRFIPSDVMFNNSSASLTYPTASISYHPPDDADDLLASFTSYVTVHIPTNEVPKNIVDIVNKFSMCCNFNFRSDVDYSKFVAGDYDSIASSLPTPVVSDDVSSSDAAEGKSKPYCVPSVPKSQQKSPPPSSSKDDVNDFKFKKKKYKSPKCIADMRAAITAYFKNVELPVGSTVLDVGSGNGKSLSHLDAMCTQDGHYTVTCVDKDAGALAELRKEAVKYRMHVKTIQMDMNKIFPLREDTCFDMVTSFFAWHFHTAPEDHSMDQIHILPIYNPDTYGEWSKFYEVKTNQQTPNSVSHVIKSETFSSNETLYTMEYWKEKFGCEFIELIPISELLTNPHPHHSNFLMITHNGHDDDSSGSDSEPLDFLPDDGDDYESDLSSHESDISTSSKPDTNIVINQMILSIHSSYEEDCCLRNNISFVLSGKGADLCRFNCGCCTWDLDIDGEDNIVWPEQQFLENLALYSSCNLKTLNVVDEKFLTDLHTRKIVTIHPSDSTIQPSDITWVQVGVETPHRRVLLLTPEKRARLNQAILDILLPTYDCTVSTVKQACESSASTIHVFADNKDQAIAIYECLHDNIRTNVGFFDFQIGDCPMYYLGEDFTTKRAKTSLDQSWYQKVTPGKLWRCIASFFEEGSRPLFQCHYEGVHRSCPDGCDRTNFILQFEKEYGLYKCFKFETENDVYYLPPAKPNQYQETLEGFYYNKNKSEHVSDYIVVNGTVQNKHQTKVATLVYSNKGIGCYINGKRENIPEMKRKLSFLDIVSHALKSPCILKGKLYISHYSEHKPSKFKIWSLSAFFPFIAFPNVFTFAISILAFCCTLPAIKSRFSVIPKAVTFVHSVHEVVVAKTAAYLKPFSVSTVAAFWKWFAIFAFFWLTMMSCYFFSIDSDIVNLAKPAKHSFLQQIAVFLKYIPPLDHYKSSLTLRDACSEGGWLCKWGRPSNWHYLNEYSEYVRSAKSFNTMDIFVYLFFYINPLFWFYLINPFSRSFTPSPEVAVMNFFLLSFLGLLYYFKLMKCCSYNGKRCPRHASRMNPNIPFIIDGRNYLLPFNKVSFCTRHNWWCNSSRHHIMPSPIARSIEETCNIKRNSIKCDSYFKFVADTNAIKLPDKEIDFDPKQVYDISHLDYSTWTSRCALFSYRCGQVVKLAALPNGDYNTSPTAMTKEFFDFFKDLGDPFTDYIAGVSVSDHNNLHLGLFKHLSDKQFERLNTFSFQVGQTYGITTIETDKFLNGKFPSDFQKMSGVLSVPYTTNTIDLAFFSCHLQDDVRRQAAEFGFKVKVPQRPKRSLKSLFNVHNIFVFIVCVLVALAAVRCFYKKVHKRGFPAGVNPTGYDYRHGKLFLLDDTPYAEPVSLAGIVKYQAWRFPNGTTGFTMGRVSVQQRTDCGLLKPTTIEYEKKLGCGKYRPASISVVFFTIYFMQPHKDYVTIHGHYDAGDQATCFGYENNLYCHVATGFMTTGSFILLTSLLVLFLVACVWIFVKLHRHFGSYTTDVIALVGCHTVVVVVYSFYPLLAMLATAGILFIPFKTRSIFFMYVGCVFSMLCGVSLFIIIVIYSVVFAIVFFLKSSPKDGAVYTSDGLVFGPDFSQIAKSTFSIAPDTIYKVINATGLTFEQILKMSRGGGKSDEKHLATQLISSQVQNITLIYEPATRQIPTVLQKAVGRLTESVISTPAINNMCSIVDASLNDMGHGIFLDSQTVITARHVYEVGCRVQYKGEILDILDTKECGFNIRLTVVPQKIVKLSYEDHHELVLGCQYVHFTTHGVQDANQIKIFPVIPTQSGHFAFAKTFAGESGSPVFLNGTLVAIHQGMIRLNDNGVATTHAVSCRIDGTPFDPSFHDITKTASSIVFDGLTIVKTIIKNVNAGLVDRATFRKQINDINKKINSLPYVTSITDSSFLQGDAYDLSAVVKFFDGTPIISEAVYQPYKEVTQEVVCQSMSTPMKAYAEVTVGSIISIIVIFFKLFDMGFYDRWDPAVFIQGAFAALVGFAIFRTRQSLYTITLIPWLVPKVHMYILLVISNFSLFKYSVQSEDFINWISVRLGMMDLAILVVILFFILLKLAVVPRRTMFFAIFFWTVWAITYSYNDDMDTVEFLYAFAADLAVFVVCVVSPSSGFAYASYAMMNTRYAVWWFAVNFVLSLKFNYPTWLKAVYRQLTSDKIVVSRLYMSSFTVTHGRLPSYYEALLSNLFYSGNGGCLEFTPQSQFLERLVVGQHVKTTSIQKQSAALMNTMDPDVLSGFFVQAVDIVLQSSAENQRDFVMWVDTVVRIAELQKWLQDNPIPPGASRKSEQVKRANIVHARIAFLQAKEQKLIKQLELMQQEQVRGLVRQESALKLATMLDKAVKAMIENASMRYKRFAEGIVGLSTITTPDMIVLSTPAAKDSLFYDDETESFFLQIGDDVYNFVELKDNSGRVMEKKHFELLNDTNFPLTGRVSQDLHLQANVGFDVSVGQVVVESVDGALVCKYKDIPYLKEVSSQSETTITLPFGPSVKHFEILKSIRPELLATIMTKLRDFEIELQGHIRIGGLPNSIEHVAQSSVPLRTAGYTTVFGPSICSHCISKIPHECKLQGFIQIPINESSYIKFVQENKICLTHNKFKCLCQGGLQPDKLTADLQATRRGYSNKLHAVLQRYREQAKNL